MDEIDQLQQIEINRPHIFVVSISNARLILSKKSRQRTIHHVISDVEPIEIRIPLLNILDP